MTALNAIITGIKTIIAVAGSIPMSPSGPFITVDNVAEGVDGDVKKEKSIVEQGLQGIIVINFSLITLTTLLAQIDALISLCLIEGLDNGDIDTYYKCDQPKIQDNFIISLRNCNFSLDVIKSKYSYTLVLLIFSGNSTLYFPLVGKVVLLDLR